jgi:hypothetical protein
MAEDRKTAILDLTVDVERPIVRIDGQNYQLHTPEELSLLEFRIVRREARRLSELLQQINNQADAASDEVVEEFVDALDRLCRRILLAPDAVHQRLREQHRLTLIETFSSLLTEMMERRRAAGAMQEAVATTTDGSELPPA